MHLPRVFRHHLQGPTASLGLYINAGSVNETDRNTGELAACSATPSLAGCALHLRTSHHASSAAMSPITLPFCHSGTPSLAGCTLLLRTSHHGSSAAMSPLTFPFCHSGTRRHLAPPGDPGLQGDTTPHPLPACTRGAPVRLGTWMLAQLWHVPPVSKSSSAARPEELVMLAGRCTLLARHEVEVGLVNHAPI